MSETPDAAAGSALCKVPTGILSGAPRFDAVLAVRACARSPHFHVHHRPVAHPVPVLAAPAEAAPGELSTGPRARRPEAVDETLRRLGMIVPKRHARRSVTRSLIKRRIRAQWQARAADLPAGDWVVRLTAPIDRAIWPSAASGALAQAMSRELAEVLEQASRRAKLGPQPARMPGSARTKPSASRSTTTRTERHG